MWSDVVGLETELDTSHEEEGRIEIRRDDKGQEDWRKSRRERTGRRRWRIEMDMLTANKRKLLCMRMRRSRTRRMAQ